VSGSSLTPMIFSSSISCLLYGLTSNKLLPYSVQENRSDGFPDTGLQSAIQKVTFHHSYEEQSMQHQILVISSVRYHSVSLAMLTAENSSMAKSLSSASSGQYSQSAYPTASQRPLSKWYGFSASAWSWVSVLEATIRCLRLS
jgi:hypothetical protein